MTSTTIDTETVSATVPPATRGTTVEDYLRFRAIIDDYQEPERPSIVDVKAAAFALGQCSEGSRGQNTVNAALRSAPRDWIFQYDKTTGRTHRRSPITMRGADTIEGRTLRLYLSPGIIGAKQIDVNRAAKTREARESREHKMVDMLNAMRVDLETGEISDELPDFSTASKSEITEWSARSRSNMHKTLASLDYSGWGRECGALAMVTLTLPGAWEVVAPDGATFKKLVKRFEGRWRRAGLDWACLWKLEFQRRGAPHWHALMRVPALVKGVPFEQWLSRTWADCVAHPDPEERAKHLLAGTGVDFSGKDFSDPRRIALYFAGHSAKSEDGKEYQHIVPELWQQPGKGPGRFWGFCGLVKALVEVDVTQRDYDRARRVLRHLARSRAWVTAVKRERGHAAREGRTALPVYQVRAKKLRRSQLGGGGGFNGGWVLLNDALGLAWDLARYLES